MVVLDRMYFSTELYGCNGGGWSSEVVDLNLGNNTNSMRLYPNQVSDTLMLVVQDDGSDLNYIVWNGSSWGSNNQLETFSGETKNQPFLYFWNANTTTSTGNSTGNSGNYVLRIDTGTLPANSILTTGDTEIAVFTTPGEVDCGNNFGFYPHLPPVANPDSFYVDAGYGGDIGYHSE